MAIEIAPVPVCTDLDLGSYDGPWQHLSRFRGGSGWLLIAETTIQSEHDILTTQVVAACDEQENPIPSFQAVHLTECDWLNPSQCREIPPDILQDQLYEEEGALLVRWHRERNSALAEAFERQEARVAELEGRARAFVRGNDGKIAKLRRQRRHPAATPEIRGQLAAIIRELEEENDEVMAEMADTRAVIRQQAEEFEERLWQRADVLVETTPVCLVHWCSLVTSRYEPPMRPTRYSTLYIPASGRTGGSVRSDAEWEVLEKFARLAAERRGQSKAIQSACTPADYSNETMDGIALPSSTYNSHPWALENSDEYKTLKRLERNRLALDKRISSMKSALVEIVPVSSRRPLIARRLEKALQASEALDHKLAIFRKSLGIEEGKPSPSTPMAIEAPEGEETSPEDDTTWTPERVQLLERLWRLGKSASAIAQILGGTSRKAVIGKAKRLGLPFCGASSEEKSEPSSAFSPIDGGKAILALDSEITRLKERRSALEVEGRKFFSGSTKYERNRAERIELTRQIDRLVKRTAAVRCSLKVD